MAAVVKYDESCDAKKYGSLIEYSTLLKQMTANDANNLLDDIGKSIREPFADFSIFPTYLVSKKRKMLQHYLEMEQMSCFWIRKVLVHCKKSKYSKMPYFIKYGIYGIDKIIQFK